MTDPVDERAAIVAEGLTEAQRRVIRAAPKTKTGYWAVLAKGARATTLQALKRREIITGLTFLTPLGLAVRAHLIAKDQTHD